MNEHQKRGKPPLEEGELAVRIHISLPLSLAQQFREQIPEKERSKVVSELLRKYLQEKDSLQG